MRCALGLLLVATLTPPACVVETGFPDDVQLVCHETGECPSGWSCDLDEELCVRPTTVLGDAVDTAGGG